MARPLIPVRTLPLAADPTGTFTNGDAYYNTATKRVRYFDGTQWVEQVNAGTTKSFTQLNPEIAAGQTWTVTHGLGSENVITVVRREAAPKDVIDVYTSIVNANSLQIAPDRPMAAGAFRIVVYSDSVLGTPVTSLPYDNTDWIDITGYTNGYQAYRGRGNNGVSFPQYRRLGGMVVVKGMITPPTTTANENAIATLPAGFRPTEQKHLIGTAAGGQPFFYSITAQGVIVQKIKTNDNTAWVSIDNLSFVAEQ